MDHETEVPQYFICPISLQIMKDPVTTVTGISYDRESIQKWFNTWSRNDAICPVTKQVLPRDSDLTPNHTLRRLIQAWCTATATATGKHGGDRIPTPPKSPLDRIHVLKLIEDLKVPHLFMSTLNEIESLAKESETERKCLVEAGMEKIMAFLITQCFKQGSFIGLEEALRILYLIWMPSNEIKVFVNGNREFMDSLIWVSKVDINDNHVAVKTHALLVLKLAMEVASTNLLERLKPEFFKEVVSVLRDKKISQQQATKSALRALVQACPHGGNRIKIVEANAVFDLIEFELKNTEKGITELVFNLLAELCSCADGRAQFLAHAGSLAMLSKRILRVSPATDERALHILLSISKFSATNEVLSEMLTLGAVSKLSMVVQADCEAHLKQKASRILRLHSNVWKDSPCIAVYLLTRHPR